MQDNQHENSSALRTFAIWGITFVVANVGASIAISVTGYAAVDVVPTWVLALSAFLVWIPFIGVLVWNSKAYETGNFCSDYRISFKPSDAWGIPIGVASQLFLVGLVTIPFRWLFPSTFNAETVEKRANDLFDAAHGLWMVLLVVVVVVCAPLVEEILYRGFIQQNLSRSVGARWGLIIASVWFAAVHLQLAEFPGLFAFALVLGLCFVRTNRIGMSIVAHVSFNASALVVIALTR